MRKFTVGDYVAYDSGALGRIVVQILEFDVDTEYNTYVLVRTLSGHKYYAPENKLSFY